MSKLLDTLAESLHLVNRHMMTKRLNMNLHMIDLDIDKLNSSASRVERMVKDMEKTILAYEGSLILSIILRQTQDTNLGFISLRVSRYHMCQLIREALLHFRSSIIYQQVEHSLIDIVNIMKTQLSTQKSFLLSLSSLNKFFYRHVIDDLLPVPAIILSEIRRFLSIELQGKEISKLLMERFKGDFRKSPSHLVSAIFYKSFGVYIDSITLLDVHREIRIFRPSYSRDPLHAILPMIFYTYFRSFSVPNLPNSLFKFSDETLYLMNRVTMTEPVESSPELSSDDGLIDYFSD